MIKRNILIAMLLCSIVLSCNPMTPDSDPAPTNGNVAEPKGTQVPKPLSDQQILRGIAVLGDSFYDEYRGSDLRGGDYADVTFNLVELLVKLRGLNFGQFGDWGFPRRVGYEFNWAHSGDTSTDLIRNGQHLGAAKQVREGKVSFVFIGIGANDFNPHYGDDYAQIYSGEMTDAQLTRKIDRAVANVTLAVDTVLAARPQGVAMTLFTQMSMDPKLPENYPDPQGRQRVIQAVDEINQRLREMAAERGVVVLDQNRFGEDVILPNLKNGYFSFGRAQIDFLNNGDAPVHARLLDGQHIGTVISGLCANYYFIEMLNTHFHTNIEPLSEEEILSSAGL